MLNDSAASGLREKSVSGIPQGRFAGCANTRCFRGRHTASRWTQLRDNSMLGDERSLPIANTARRCPSPRGGLSHTPPSPAFLISARLHTARSLPGPRAFPFLPLSDVTWEPFDQTNGNSDEKARPLRGSDDPGAPGKAADGEALRERREPGPGGGRPGRGPRLSPPFGTPRQSVPLTHRLVTKPGLTRAKAFRPGRAKGLPHSPGEEKGRGAAVRSLGCPGDSGHLPGGSRFHSLHRTPSNARSFSLHV